MTDEQIIKALECCNQEDMCDQCPYDFACYDEKYKSILSKDALDLINRQKAEIESLKHRKTELQIRNQELQHEKSEAIKEFAERLKAKATVVHKTHGGKHWYEIDDEDIDNLVKEMMEVNEK